MIFKEDPQIVFMNSGFCTETRFVYFLDKTNKPHGKIRLIIWLYVKEDNLVFGVIKIYGEYF